MVCGERDFLTTWQRKHQGISSMDATRINRPPESDTGDAESNQVHQFAPTLIGGEVPGSQGVVRVWLSNVWLLRSSVVQEFGALLCILGIVVAGLTILSMPIESSDHFGALTFLEFGIGVLVCTLNLWSALRLLRRPKCVTTDDAGIAIITRKGSRALIWSEIVECTRLGTLLTLVTGRDRVSVSLPGYLPSVRQELFATVAHHANLYSDGSERCVRAERLKTAQRVQPELRSSGPRLGHASLALAASLALLAILF